MKASAPFPVGNHTPASPWRGRAEQFLRSRELRCLRELRVWESFALWPSLTLLHSYHQFSSHVSSFTQLVCCCNLFQGERPFDYGAHLPGFNQASDFLQFD